MQNDQPSQKSDFSSSEPNDSTALPIRTQLLWSALFPLAICALLSILAATSAFYKLTLNLALQRNSAQVQSLATLLVQQLTQGANLESQDLSSMIPSLGVDGKSNIYIIDRQGKVINSSGTAIPQDFLDFKGLPASTLDGEISSRLLHLPGSDDEVMISVSPIAGTEYYLIQMEPWVQIMAPSLNYQWLFAGLAILGVFLSLFILSMSIDRIIQPIKTLAESATQTIPGSIFYPLEETGPREIRALINAFNKMVIRLAVQQKSLRQYSHSALLSQENERLRLSHELHDGTLQDLIGLSQRVELCCQELAMDPKLAQERLDEIHRLLKHSIDDVRNISNALRPTVLEDLGLMIAIEALCKEMNRQRPGIHCEFIKTGIIRRLPPEEELAIYRVVQEALTNIRKHAPDASTASVEIIFNDQDVVTNIRNDGSAFFNQDIQGHVRTGHIGLAGMDERARLFGGKLTITSNPGEKTIITLQLPYARGVD